MWIELCFFDHFFYLLVLSTFQRQCKGQCMFSVAAFIWLAMSCRSQGVLIANKTKVNTEREETAPSACSHTDESAPFLCLQPLAALSLILPYLHPFQLSCFLRSSTFNTSLADGWNQTNWQTDLRKSNVTFLLSLSTSHLIAMLAFSVSLLSQPRRTKLALNSATPCSFLWTRRWIMAMSVGSRSW